LTKGDLFHSQGKDDEALAKRHKIFISDRGPSEKVVRSSYRATKKGENEPMRGVGGDRVIQGSIRGEKEGDRAAYLLDGESALNWRREKEGSLLFTREGLKKRKKKLH